MIEEAGRVVAVEPGVAWVETIRQSSCASCSAQKGCGHSVLIKSARRHTHIRALCTAHCAVGDKVIIGIPESVVVSSSLLAYFMPLVFMLAAAGGGHAFNLGDALTSLLALLGLALGFSLVYLHFLQHRRDERYQPVVLRFENEVPAKICSAEVRL